MSYTTLTIDSISNNAGTIAAKTIIGSGLTGTAAYSFTGCQDESLRVLVTNDGATGIATFYAGDYCEMSSGNLDLVVGGAVTKVVQLDGARFRQNDGTLLMGIGFTGSCYAFQGA